MSMTVPILVAFITGVIGPVIVLILKDYQDKKKKGDMMLDTLHVSERVTTKLDHIREQIHADRVWLIQFHNGGNFYPTGKSIAKFSMTYEAVSGGTTSMQNSFQNIPVTLFSKPINFLLENDEILIPDYKDETIATYGLKYIADEYGCKSSYFFAIKTMDDKLVGVMGVDFTKKKLKLNEDQLAELARNAATIGGVLVPTA